jgi:hypothetical protein
LVVYAVGDVLLTPVAGFETRPVAQVTTLGFITLGLLFVGLVLAIISLVLLFRSSKRAPMLAIVAAVLYYPAVLAEQTGHFSSVHPPAAIERIELVQVVVALAVIAIGYWTLRKSPTNKGPG